MLVATFCVITPTHASPREVRAQCRSSLMRAGVQGSVGEAGRGERPREDKKGQGQRDASECVSSSATRTWVSSAASSLRLSVLCPGVLGIGFEPQGVKGRTGRLCLMSPLRLGCSSNPSPPPHCVVSSVVSLSVMHWLFGCKPM